MPESEWRVTVESLAREYFEQHLNEEVMQQEVTSWIIDRYKEATGRPPQDPWRAVRKLAQDGWLIKVRKGVYKRVEGYQGPMIDADFTPEVREQIFKRDDYRCVICQRGPHSGHEIHADHIVPRDRGGKSTLENGQTLCSEHNLQKKNYGPYVFFRRYADRMRKFAEQSGDKRHLEMMQKVIEVLESYGYKSVKKQ